MLTILPKRTTEMPVESELVIDFHSYSLEKAKFCLIHALAHASQISKIRVITGRDNYMNRFGKQAILYQTFYPWIMQFSYQHRIKKIQPYHGYYEIHLHPSSSEEKHSKYGQYFLGFLPSQVKVIKEQADKGDAEAQFALAVCLTEQAKDEQGLKDAFTYFLRAAENRHADAMISIARCYIVGRGVKQDDGEAVKWLRTAMKHHQVEASLLLGDCYWEGYGVQRDFAKAVYYYQLSAANNNPVGMQKLASAYRTGVGIKEDTKVSFDWYKKAADLGEATSQYNVAVELESKLSENPTEAEKKEIFSYFLRSAERGESDAQCKVGCCYMFGQYVTADEKLGHYWLTVAAENGSAQASELLRWPKQNDVTVLQQFAQAGNILACFKLKCIQRKRTVREGESVKLFQEAYKEIRELPLTKIIHLDSMSKFMLIDEMVTDKEVRFCAKGFQALQTMAKDGCIYSIRRLVKAYINGIGVNKNIPKVFTYLEEAYKLKDGKCAMFLGDIYQKGLLGQATDFKKAMVYYENSAAWGYPPANYFIGSYYCSRGEIIIGIAYLKKAIDLECDEEVCLKKFRSGFGDIYQNVKQDAAATLGIASLGSQSPSRKRGIKYLRLAINWGSKLAEQFIAESKKAGLEEIFSCQWFETEDLGDDVTIDNGMSSASSSSASSAIKQSISESKDSLSIGTFGGVQLREAAPMASAVESKEKKETNYSQAKLTDSELEQSKAIKMSSRQIPVPDTSNHLKDTTNRKSICDIFYSFLFSPFGTLMELFETSGARTLAFQIAGPLMEFVAGYLGTANPGSVPSQTNTTASSSQISAASSSSSITEVARSHKSDYSKTSEQSDKSASAVSNKTEQSSICDRNMARSESASDRWIGAPSCSSHTDLPSGYLSSSSCSVISSSSLASFFSASSSSATTVTNTLFATLTAVGSNSSPA